MLAFYLSALETEEERETLSELYEKHKDSLHWVAYRITQNRELAEEAVHNAFYEIIKQRERFFSLSRGKQRSLIVIIVRNKSIDLMRYENIRTSVPLDSIEEQLPSDSLDNYLIFQKKSDLEHIIACVNRLPDIYKLVFELRYVNEMSNKEIAEFLDISQRAVSMRLHRARLALQEILEKEGVINER